MSDDVSDDDDNDCPLCVEPFGLDDAGFFPCSCRYQVCRFCWHRIRNDEDGLCPACRQPYPEEPAEYAPLTMSEIQEIRSEKKKKRKEKRQKEVDMRRQLSSVRVVQKNLVYVIGLPHRVAVDDSILRRGEYFGKYGKILKIVINRNNHYNSGPNPTVSAYVTFARKQDASACVRAVDKSTLDGRMLRASFGTTKYCSNFLKHQPCLNPDCMYLHELGDEASSYTKQDMLEGKHNADVSLSPMGEVLVDSSGGSGPDAAGSTSGGTGGRQPTRLSRQPQVPSSQFDHYDHELHQCHATGGNAATMGYGEHEVAKYPDAIGPRRDGGARGDGHRELARVAGQSDTQPNSTQHASVGVATPSAPPQAAPRSPGAWCPSSGAAEHSVVLGTLGQHLAAAGAAPRLNMRPIDVQSSGGFVPPSSLADENGSDASNLYFQSQGLPSASAGAGVDGLGLDWATPAPQVFGPSGQKTSLLPSDDFFAGLESSARRTVGEDTLSARTVDQRVPFDAGSAVGGGLGLDGWADLPTGLSMPGSLGLGPLPEAVPPASLLPPLPGLPPATVPSQLPKSDFQWDSRGPVHLMGVSSAPTITSTQTSSRFAFARQAGPQAPAVESAAKADHVTDQWQEQLRSLFPGVSMGGATSVSSDTSRDRERGPAAVAALPSHLQHQPPPEFQGGATTHIRQKRGRGRGFAGSSRGRGAIGRGGGRGQHMAIQHPPQLADPAIVGGSLPLTSNSNGGFPVLGTSLSAGSSNVDGAKHLEALFSGLALQQAAKAQNGTAAQPSSKREGGWPPAGSQRSTQN
mmetsp:Transcript_21140/g.54996  ORF Transcript_21140/g.54996 Transcript_21140/m.54996 type:complete len:800 (-) Transcript_21140:1424-3823(-)